MDLRAILIKWFVTLVDALPDEALNSLCTRKDSAVETAANRSAAQESVSPSALDMPSDLVSGEQSAGQHTLEEPNTTSQLPDTEGRMPAEDNADIPPRALPDEGDPVSTAAEEQDPVEPATGDEYPVAEERLSTERAADDSTDDAVDTARPVLPEDGSAVSAATAEQDPVESATGDKYAVAEERLSTERAADDSIDDAVDTARPVLPEDGNSISAATAGQTPAMPSTEDDHIERDADLYCKIDKALLNINELIVRCAELNDDRTRINEINRLYESMQALIRRYEAANGESLFRTIRMMCSYKEALSCCDGFDEKKKDIERIYQYLVLYFRAIGYDVICPQRGDPYDENIMKAYSTGAVVEKVVDIGYKKILLNDEKVIRHAIVELTSGEE